MYLETGFLRSFTIFLHSFSDNSTWKLIIRYLNKYKNCIIYYVSNGNLIHRLCFSFYKFINKFIQPTNYYIRIIFYENIKIIAIHCRPYQTSMISSDTLFRRSDRSDPGSLFDVLKMHLSHWNLYRFRPSVTNILISITKLTESTYQNYLVLQINLHLRHWSLVSS